MISGAKKISLDLPAKHFLSLLEEFFSSRIAVEFFF